MKLKFHGAAKEVGRSCIELVTKNKRFLFDAGLKITPFGNEYPTRVDKLNEIDAVFISHAHLDHTGALPVFNKNGILCPVYCTHMTKRIMEVLLRDSWKIERIKNIHTSYQKLNIRKVMKQVSEVRFNKEMNVDGTKFKYYYAGHIPGAASVLLEEDGKKVFYTGDINNGRTYLVDELNYDNLHDVDVMIVESTYGNREHPSRFSQEEDFIERIKETINNGGSVLIPTFAVGRAQEIMMILSREKFKVPIYLDGMAKQITEIFMEDEHKSISDKKLLKKAYDSLTEIRRASDRRSAASRQGIFITTSGMMDGGPVMEYVKHIYKDPKNAILLTGFQAEETNGRLLLERGKLRIEKNTFKRKKKTDKTYFEEEKVRCYYEKFDFSAHAGSRGLKNVIKQINPKNLIINHGDPESIEELAEWAKAMGFKTYVPELDFSLTIDLNV